MASHITWGLAIDNSVIPTDKESISQPDTKTQINLQYFQKYFKIFQFSQGFAFKLSKMFQEKIKFFSL